MIKFRMAAKTDMGLVRTNNEDNFQAAADLSSGKMRWVNNELYSLGDKGTLLVVADGMGGMNAGEVASELAIETVRKNFAAQNLTLDVTRNRFSIEKFMNDTIVAADARIKSEAKIHPESKGMGTTIVIGWVYNDKLYVSWCGDSRAYVYSPEAGLHQITKDHSYVQGLVDKGAISREDAFDFPDSNIITRSLGDAAAKARPESLMKPYSLCDGDIVLLCTDGLSGMIRDEEIEAVIRDNSEDMDVLADELIRAACRAEGSDNITVCLLKVISGGGTFDREFFEETEKWLNGKRGNVMTPVVSENEEKTNSKKRLLLMLSCLVVLCVAGAAIWLMSGNKEGGQDNATEVSKKQSPEQEKNGAESADSVAASLGDNKTAKRDEKKQKPANNKSGDKTNPDALKGDTIIQSPLTPIDSTTSNLVPKGLTLVQGGTDETGNGVVTIEGETSDNVEGEGETETYIVKQRDTLYDIAKKYNEKYKNYKNYNITVKKLQEVNGIENDEVIHPGDTLKVPVPKKRKAS